jgi:FHA domain
MNDKPLNPGSQPSAIPDRPATQWVMVFTLLMKQGKEEIKKTFKVNKKRLVIGSALSSDIRIQQNSVSNVHAVVEMDDQGITHIYDMASETGVFVNDQKRVSAELRDDDEIKIGFATLGYKRMAVAEAQKAVPAGSVRTTGSGRKLFYDTQEDFRPLILEDERNVIQIFDYPNSSEQALQVVMYWNDIILDVKHIVNHETVTLGDTRKATFVVPDTQDFPLVSFDGSTVALQFSDKMTGVVRTNKELVPLNQLPSNRFHLKKDDLAKVQIKDIAFFVSYSPLPPHLRRQRIIERDPLYTQIWFTSLGLTAALVAILAAINPPKKLDTEELPPRVANIIFKPVEPPKPPPEPVKPPPKPPEPEKKVEPPKKPPPPPPPPKKPPPPPKEPPKKLEPPKPVPIKTKPLEQHVQAAANQVKGGAAKPAGGNEGEGARHKGEEGQKGQPNKPKAPVHMNASKGNPNAKTPQKSQVQGPGNVESLFNDIGGNISHSMAAGSLGVKNAAGNLRGAGAFTTEGNGGLGNTGSGKGGGGTSDIGQGLGTKGLGEGAHGKGFGAIGSGGDISGTGHGRPNVEVGNSSETIIMGGLDKSVIDEYIKRHMPQIRACYERQLNSAKAGLSGRIATHFEISGSGRVSMAAVSSSTLGEPNVENCLLGVLKHIVFPEPVGGGTVAVDYPFSFTPSVAGK